MTQRVTDEQARHIAGCDPTVYVQPGLGPGVTTSDLAADLLDARADLAALRTKLDALCDAAEDAIGYAHQHDSDGRITFIDRSQPIAQYSDDGPDAWPARLHAAIAAAREGKP